jgi:hypothetical protein
MRVPILVIRPLRLSDRTDDSTSVEPFSDGASRAAHSSKPAFSDCSVSRSCTSSQSSSRACEAACSSTSWASSMGGQMAADMAKTQIQAWCLRSRDAGHAPGSQQIAVRLHPSARPGDRGPSGSRDVARWPSAMNLDAITSLQAAGLKAKRICLTACSTLRPSRVPSSNALDPLARGMIQSASLASCEVID